MADPEPYKLPRAALPRRYQLELRPDLVADRFDGTVHVTLDVTEPVDRLVMNAADLDISDATLETPASLTLPGSTTLDEAEQRVTVSFDRTLDPGAGYGLTLRFGARLGEHLRGLYRSTFTDGDGTHILAATQFEPSDARRAFPCWDEPDFKASFEVTLVVDEALTAISNEAPVSEERLAGGLRKVRFAETMVMSTYLVACVVGPFELSEAVTVEGVPVRIAAVPGRMGLAEYASRSAVHALQFLSRYFEIPYPGGKLDHVAIPDFAFGAMENLGCVTYRENALLVDPDAASQSELQRVATVIAHETAHMWFGNLVTMRWWDGIWLNEAFATFMELTTTEAFNPAWRVWATFGAGKAAAMGIDGLRSTRPVEFQVGRPEEAEAMFDLLTYQKGGSVLRMLEQYLGAETFRKGISHYLRTHAHANTETTDLWDALEEVSGEPVRAVMETWIGQGGLPVISVRRGDDDPASITLQQRRFLYSGEPGDQLWGVPINLRASVGGQVQRQRLLLDERSATVSFDGPVDWVVVNDGGWGFYRTLYEPDLLARLTGAGLQEVCDPLERHALVVDSWAAVVAGRAELSDWAALVTSLGDERDPDVWSAVASGVELLDLLGSDEDRSALAAFVRRVAGPVRDELGWDPDPEEDERTGVARGRVLGLVGMSGEDPQLRAEALQRFRLMVDQRPGERTMAGIAPDLLTPVAQIVASSGGEAGWAGLLNEYRVAVTPQDKVRYLFALAAAENPGLVRRCLDLALSDEVRTQDAPFLLAGVLRRRAGARLAWDWIVVHWEELRARWPSGLLARALEVLPAIVDPALAEEVHQFAATHEMPLVPPRIDQVLEAMDINVELARRLRSTLSSSLTGP